MRSKWKQTTFLVLSCASLYGITVFCQKQTDSFSIAKIEDNFTLSPCVVNKQTLDQESLYLLDKPFHYLGRGKQSFVFESEDKTTVIKFFSNRYQRKVRAFTLLSHLPFISSWAKCKAQYNEKKLNATFVSYQIAYDKLKEQTALVSLHTAPTPLASRTITIIDKLGIHHTLNAENFAFLIQKKVKLVYPALLESKQEDNLAQAEKRIRSLIELLYNKYQLGIADNDPLIRTNFGFIQDRAVEIDVGPFSYSESVQSPSFYKPEIRRITTSLRSWLENHYPELLPSLDKELLDKDLL